MEEGQYCESCGRKLLMRCSFCGSDIGSEFEDMAKSQLCLDFTVQVPQYDGADVEELAACHKCAIRFLTKEAIEEIKKVSDIVMGDLN